MCNKFEKQNRLWDLLAEAHAVTNNGKLRLKDCVSEDESLRMAKEYYEIFEDMDVDIAINSNTASDILNPYKMIQGSEEVISSLSHKAVEEIDYLVNDYVDFEKENLSDMSEEDDCLFEFISTLSYRLEYSL